MTRHKRLCTFLAAVGGFFFALAAGSARAALLAGDVAVIGWIDNGTPDSFSFVTLAPVSAGEVIYFTDNGWISSGTPGFRGAIGNADGDGNETLTKWTANNPIAAGTIIRTTDVSADFAWTTSGAVPGGTSGAFAPLSIGDPGEQIYALQGPASLPLQNVTTQLFVLDDTSGFEDATSSSTGNIPPGLSIAAHTAVTLAAGFDTPRSISFKTSTLASGTKSDWLTAIANSANWTSGTGVLPSGSIAVVPEPSTLAMVILGLAGLCLLKLRKRR
ncbi:MAG: PEP-CTERM sorting domain-containing protein [Planctomycetia bacterium]|nr:PEP-CTERM sorting domain-containing protein [Planctomycetia bacterium]